MSWFIQSISNSLNHEDDSQQNENALESNSKSSPSKSEPEDQSSSTTPRGVKEDLSELTKTLSRQFWGVASFLAPPPDHHRHWEHPPPETEEEEGLIEGIRSDFVEIGGKFKSGISKFSGNIVVSDITKLASSFLQIGEETDVADNDLIGSVVGVTDEVVAFARDLAMHPETWLDFPVPPDVDDFEDFDMSDAQQDHALAVEHLCPRLAALRLQLCPQFMNDGCFWKIYFVLVHPRLGKEAALLLSTPQIVEARAALSTELRNLCKRRPNPQLVSSESTLEESISMLSPAEFEPASVETYDIEVVQPAVASETSHKDLVSPAPSEKSETAGHPAQGIEIQFVDKAVADERINKIETQNRTSISSPRVVEKNFQDDDDDWLKEESPETVGATGTNVPIFNDEDISFSDLEDDDDVDVPLSYKTDKKP